MPTPPDPTVSMVRSAASWCLPLVPVVGVVGLLWQGPAAGLSAAAGALVVTAFFAFGVLGVNVLVSALPTLAVVAAFAVYATQLLVLLLVVVVARDHVAVDRPAFASGAVAATMVWQVAHARAFLTTRQPLYPSTAPKEEP